MLSVYGYKSNSLSWLISLHGFCSSCSHIIWHCVISTDYFTSLLEAEFSSTSSPYSEAEHRAYVFFWDFIDDVEGLYLVM